MDQLKQAVRVARQKMQQLKDKAEVMVKKARRKLSKKRKKARKSTPADSPVTYRNLVKRRKAKKDMRARKKAQYLATLPKSRYKRILYRLHPKRFFAYWFSRQGAIMALKLTGIGIVLVTVVVLGAFAYFRRDLGDPRDVSSRTLSQTTKFYDRTGKTLLFEVYGDQNRTIVNFDEISDHMKAATVAVEDKDFYNHNGFSVSGIIRAAWSNVTSGDATSQGGSTITQQFVKNSLLTDEQTYTRKIKELILSVELERSYSKDEILAFYLNEIPYGSLEYGVEAAARAFFDKSANDLGIAESAMLAALPQAPSYYSPYGNNTDDLILRAHTIINLMAEQGYITQEEAEKAKEVDILARVVPISERSLYDNIIAPHFVLSVQEQLEEEFGDQLVRTGGLSVITTLDLKLQRIAEKAVRQNFSKVTNPPGGGGGDNAAIVSENVETGQVLAMVGSRNFNYPKYGSFNAALADRQPGSSFKPFVYSELFKSERWGPDSFIYDTPTTFGDYAPKNFDFGYNGQETVRKALGESRNIPAVKALYIAGVQNALDLAKSMGNKSLGSADQYGLSLVLGAGEVKLAEHTHAYGTFARGGVYVPQAYVLEVKNADGDVLSKWEKSPGDQVLNEEIAYLMTDILKDDVARSRTFGRGNPNLVVPGVTHTVKTGSTDGSVDGWMMGYSAYISTGVWVGNHDNKPMDSFTSQQTGPIFTQFMREAHATKYKQDKPIFESEPEGIQRIRMDSRTGYAADDDSRQTYIGLFPSWHVKQTPDATQSYTIDSVSGLLATECTPERAREEATGGGKWPELLPDDPWFSLWAKSAGYDKNSVKPTKSDNVHDCDDELPAISLNINEDAQGIYTFTATVSEGTHDVETLHFKVDGQIVSSQNINGSGSYDYQHIFSQSGTYNISVEVIDEVLYDNSNSQNLTVNQAYSGSGLEITNPSNGENDVSIFVNFSWTDDPAANKYEICWDKQGGSDNYVCENSSNTTENVLLEPNSTYTAYVESYQGTTLLQTSSTITFSTD